MTCSGRSATTGSARSRASGARRSGTSADGEAIGIRQAQALGGVDRYRVGLHHVALGGVVTGGCRRTARMVRLRRRHDRVAAAEYAYIPGYYAVFFYDPDGIVEIVHVPGLAA